MPNVSSTDQGRVRIVEIDRPETRNAIDDQTAGELAEGKLIGRMGEGDRSPLGPVRMLLSRPVIAPIIEQRCLTEEEARRNETRLGLATAASGELQRGATAFTEGKGRHGRPVTR